MRQVRTVVRSWCPRCEESWLSNPVLKHALLSDLHPELLERYFMVAMQVLEKQSLQLQF